MYVSGEMERFLCRFKLPCEYFLVLSHISETKYVQGACLKRMYLRQFLKKQVEISF